MTIEEAQSELNRLTALEPEAWLAVEAKRIEREKMEALWQSQFDPLNRAWSEIYSRIRQLKGFLEMK